MTVHTSCALVRYHTGDYGPAVCGFLVSGHGQLKELCRNQRQSRVIKLSVFAAQICCWWYRISYPPVSRIQETMERSPVHSLGALVMAAPGGG